MSVEFIFKTENGEVMTNEEASNWIKKSFLSVKSLWLETKKRQYELLGPSPQTSFINTQESRAKNLRQATKDLSNYKFWAYPDAKKKKIIEITLNDEALKWCQWVSSRVQLEVDISFLSNSSSVFNFKSNSSNEYLEKLESHWDVIQSTLWDRSWLKTFADQKEFFQFIDQKVFYGYDKRFILQGGYGWCGSVFEDLIIASRKGLPDGLIKNRKCLQAKRVDVRNLEKEGAEYYREWLMMAPLDALKEIMRHPHQPSWHQSQIAPLISPATFVVLGAFLAPWNEEEFLRKKSVSLLEHSLEYGEIPFFGQSWMDLHTIKEIKVEDHGGATIFDIDREKSKEWVVSRLAVLKDAGHGLNVEDMRLIQRTLKVLQKESNGVLKKCFTTMGQIMNEVWMDISLNQPWEEEVDMEGGAILTKKKRL